MLLNQSILTVPDFKEGILHSNHALQQENLQRDRLHMDKLQGVEVQD